jgi:hypothetical protein
VKALSVKNPWAAMIADGRKTIETRTWPTRHRGEILIVASKRGGGPNAGHAVCVARLVDCRPMTRRDERAACIDLYSGAWAWLLEDIRPIKPFPVRGRLKLYDVQM